MLNGPCHGDFAACWSKLLKYLTKNLFSNRKLLLQHLGRKYEMTSLENTNYNQLFAIFPKHSEGT